LVIALGGLSVPQDVPPDVANVTVSAGTPAPTPLVTVALIVEVAVPFAGIGLVLAVTATWLTPVWVIVVVPLPPKFASLALTVHVPAVVDAV
jgi:hypothetical protein